MSGMYSTDAKHLTRLGPAAFAPREVKMTGMPRTSDAPDSMPQAARFLADRFRCPEDAAPLVVRGELSSNSGYFRFGPDAICYGQCSSGLPVPSVTGRLHDAREHVAIAEPSVYLPFDPVQVVDNLRCERYADNPMAAKSYTPMGVVRSIYYRVRPALGVAARRHIQRLYFRGWDAIPFPHWPVDRTVETLCEELLVLAMKSRGIDRMPFIWFWPDGASSCTMMTHDVETAAGLNFCQQLMDLNDSFAVKSSFHIVPEKRYKVSTSDHGRHAQARL